MLSLNKVEKEYVNGKKIWKLHEFNLNVSNGEFVSIVGPSGCGKTTILKLISNIIEPTKGYIKYNDITIENARKSRLLGYVPQSSVLLPYRTLESNIFLPLELLRISKKGKDMVNKVIELVDLKGCEKLYPYQLSGGMQQRVSIARALVHSPKILLLDEPFSSLDELLREKLDLELINIQHNLRNIIVFVTHSIEEAVFLSDRIIVMGNNPAGFVGEVVVDLPYDRTVELKNSIKFFELMQKVRSLIKNV